MASCGVANEPNRDTQATDSSKALKRHFHYGVSDEQALQVGDCIVIGGSAGVVRAIEPMLAERELRLVVQLLRDGSSLLLLEKSRRHSSARSSCFRRLGN